MGISSKQALNEMWNFEHQFQVNRTQSAENTKLTSKIGKCDFAKDRIHEMIIEN